MAEMVKEWGCELEKGGTSYKWNASKARDECHLPPASPIALRVEMAILGDSAERQEVNVVEVTLLSVLLPNRSGRYKLPDLIRNTYSQRHLNFRWTEVAEDVSFELVQGNGPVIIKGTVRAPLPPSDNLVNVESLQPIDDTNF